MYGGMMRIFQKCRGSSFVKRASSLVLGVCMFATLKCPHTVSILNHHSWFDSVRSRHEASCQGFWPSSKAGKTLKTRPKDEHDESKKVDPSKNEIRIVVIGTNVYAMSFTASTLLQKTENTQGCLGEVTTLEKTEQTINSHVYKINIIDTPPVSKNLEKSEQNNRDQIDKAKTLSYPEPHAIILCIPAASIADRKYTDVIQQYRNVFGDKIYRLIIVAFTHFEKFNTYDTMHPELHENDKVVRFRKKVCNAIKDREENNLDMFIHENDFIFLKQQMTDVEKSNALKQVIDIINKRRIERKEKKAIHFSPYDCAEPKCDVRNMTDTSNGNFEQSNLCCKEI